MCLSEHWQQTLTLLPLQLLQRWRLVLVLVLVVCGATGCALRRAMLAGRLLLLAAGGLVGNGSSWVQRVPPHHPQLTDRVLAAKVSVSGCYGLDDIYVPSMRLYWHIYVAS